MIDLPGDEAGYYRAALAFIDDYAVDFLAVEVICWLPEEGLAGTIDWIARLGDRIVIGDWKTRGKRHGAYPEEAAQLGSYSMAKHLVIGKFPGKLMPMPNIDGLMIVSLHANGTYHAYPLDLNEARAAANAMIGASYATEDLAVHGTRAIGDPMRGKAPPLPPDELLLARRLWLRERVRALPAEAKDMTARMWPKHIPKKADVLHHDQIDSLVEVLGRAEAEHEVPFGATDPATPEPKPGSAKSRRNQAAGTNKTTRKKASNGKH